MKLLDRYLGSRILVALVQSVFTIAFLFILIDLVTHRRADILKYDVPASIVAEYYLWFLPGMVRDFQIGAVAVLVSYLLVLGRAAQDREVVAMLASGIGLFRFIRIPALIGLLFALGVFVVTETIGVVAAQRVVELEAEYFEGGPEYDIAPVSWANLSGDWTCHVFAFDRNTMTGQGVLMLKLGEERVEQVEAEKIRWDEKTNRWMLIGGLWSVYFPKERMEVETREITVEPAPISDRPEALFVNDLNPGAKTLAELRSSIDTARHRRMPTQRAEVDYHSRFALPGISFVMMGIAIPFALYVGRGGLAAGLASSVGIGLAYLVVYAAAIGLGDLGRIEPWLAAWLANFVFGGAAAVLMLRTTT